MKSKALKIAIVAVLIITILYAYFDYKSKRNTKNLLGESSGNDALTGTDFYNPFTDTSNDIASTNLLAAKEYNSIKQFEVLPGTPLDILANTAHRIDYAIIGGDADISIDGVVVNLPDGGDYLEASNGLISVPIKFTANTGRVVGHYTY